MAHKILFIDDDTLLTQVVEQKLGEIDAPYELMRASTGEEGKDICRREKPAGIILDIMLPRENGWEVAEALRNDPETSHIPILIVSGAESSYLEPEGKDHLCEDFMTKPFDVEELLPTLDKLLGKTRN